MDSKLEKQFNQLADKDRFGEIANIIEQIPESERDMELAGWFVRSLNNCGEYEHAADVSMQYREQGENDALWHYRYAYALFYLKREAESEAEFRIAKDLGDTEVDEWIEQAHNAAIARAEKEASEAKRRAAKVPPDPGRAPFENFDFSGFWEDSEYALKNYTGAPPTEEQFAEVEARLGYKLPESYKWLMKMKNGGMPAKTCHPAATPTSWADDHVAVTGIMGVDPSMIFSVLGELGSSFMIEEWGYPDIGVAVCNCPSAGHDMIFLDYRHCGPEGEPEVVHIDQEFDYEITYLADDFESFIRGLVDEEELDAPQ